MSLKDSPLPRVADFPRLGHVCRLGLASRGNTRLARDAVELAIRRGVNYLNWCGYPDGLSEAIGALGERRGSVHVAVQLEARDKAGAHRELNEYLKQLATDYLDAVTYYYVEHLEEWQQILAPGGAGEALEEARAAGRVRAIGVTSHQRRLAAEMARWGRLDFLMIRYNAAHRGAERDIFPVTSELGLGVVAFTALRWGALLESTPEDPAEFRPPPAREWYRFVLSHPGVTVALMAPDNEAELIENLRLLEDWRTLDEAARQSLAAHGERVRRHAGNFP
jgi:predicted aldo/keto reductase-like oxidoreductase